VAILQQVHLRLDVIDRVDDPVRAGQQLRPVLFAPHLHFCVDLHPARDLFQGARDALHLDFGFNQYG
jgi:hypothetical protein